MRKIIWLKAAEKRFRKEFPHDIQVEVIDAVSELAADLWPAELDTRWMSEVGPSAVQITARGDKQTFRTVAIVKAPDGALWVIGAFKKKSKSGIATPKEEMDTLKDRYAALMRSLKGR